MIPTEEDYLRSRMTFFDWLCWYSWLPFLLYFVLLMFLIAINIEIDGRKVGPAAAILLMLVVVLRGVILAGKIERRKREYREQYK